MRERGWGPGMSIHSSSKRTPRASTFSATMSCVDIAIENRGMDRRLLACHATLDFWMFETRRWWWVAVSPARDPRASTPIPFPGLDGLVDWMAPSERLEQITNHLSNNYSRGLLNGDVAIITGNLYQFGGPRRSALFSFDDVPKLTNQYLISLLRRCAGVKRTIWLHNNPILKKKRGRSHRESVKVRPSSLLRKAQRSSLASKRSLTAPSVLHVKLWC